ncbi:Mg-chelatase subunit ChlD [Paenibacillus shirakamiensis]|uniref:Mg-chelatase subunit ChlD n=1 Tax=Paenibacillus shirakamiensis TaxID=1265935 RepID=A0ABS4JGF4_9BACL|nr:vWA domain-containing protein [Paenibacillus shirakamiensis]MBP2000799.1 Mg-chelatase subunit ChlD [Paenibacillus shirakamiensis]
MFVKIKAGLFMLIMMIMLALPGKMQIAEAAAQSSQIDAVLVVDNSNSMNKSDHERISSEAMKLFIDMLSAKGDKVGVVAYTDQIQREKALMEIQSEADKQDLKEFIDGLQRGAYTDVAVGVQEAVKVLKHGANPDHEPMIVLLADGNNDLNKGSSRTQAQSDQELSAALTEASHEQIPVYTIGLNADGKLNKAALAQISQKTGGKSFITDSADNLPQILSEIFASHLKLKMVPIQSITGNGNYQDVTVNVPNANVLEANISMISSQPVDVLLTDPSGKTVAVPSSQLLVSKSKSYTLIKLLKPVQGDWKLQVKGADKDKIDINLVFNYDLELTLDAIPAKTYKSGDNIDIQSYLISKGNKVQNAALYQGMNAVVVAKDLDTGKIQETKLSNTGDHFSGSFVVPDQHNYEIKVRAEEKSFYRETPVTKISTKANAAGTGTGSTHTTSPDKPFPVLAVVLSILGVLIVGGIAYYLYRTWQKANQGFVGQLVLEIRDNNTGEKTNPQYRKLSAFKGKFNLHQLVQLAPELKETEKIIFTPTRNDRIVLKNGTSATIEKSGRAVDATQGLEMKGGDRLTIPLSSVDKTILLEYLV